jgi:hypothetical protein
LLQDLDKELKVTGVAGGITETVCLVRCKGRFGRPTSGGWADIMMNFYFEDDAEWTHVCEIQLVHAELYNVRKNMGAHGSYNEFRAALELCEKVGVDPEEGSGADILDALVWVPGRRKTSVSETPTTAAGSSCAESALFSKLAVLQAQNARQNDKIAALEIQISSLLSTQHERFELLEKQNAEMSLKMNRVCEQLLSSSVSSF